MKTSRILRILSLLAFLLLIAPFYDSCNGERMKKAQSNSEAVSDSTMVVINPIVKNKIENITIGPENMGNQEEPFFYEKAYEFIDDEDSENAFEFAKVSIDGILEFNFTEFKKGLKEEGYGIVFFELKNFCFVLIIIVTLLVFIFSIKGRNRVYKLSKINLILLLITIICLFLEGLFETMTQIKWGYYAFITTNILIFYYSKQPLKQHNL